MTSKANDIYEPFEFEDAGRRFVCSGEKLRKSSDEMWWWFQVSTDAQNRYAPFRAESGDTQESVQARVVAYWDALLVRRAAPTVNRWQRGSTPKPADQAAPDAAAPIAPEASAPEQNATVA